MTVLDTRCRKGSRSGNGGGDSDAKADSCSEPRVLLIRRGRAPSKGMWSLPGGKVELGETLTSAAVREMKEETQLDVCMPQRHAPLAVQQTPSHITSPLNLQILLPEHPIFTATDAILPRIDDSKLHEAASHQAATGESVAADKVHYHYVLVHLLGYRASPTAQAVASDDAAGADWVSIGALPGMVERKELVPKTPFVVKQALRYHQELAASGRLP